MGYNFLILWSSISLSNVMREIPHSAENLTQDKGNTREIQSDSFFLLSQFVLWKSNFMIKDGEILPYSLACTLTWCGMPVYKGWHTQFLRAAHPNPTLSASRSAETNHNYISETFQALYLSEPTHYREKKERFNSHVCLTMKYSMWCYSINCTLFSHSLNKLCFTNCKGLYVTVAFQ